MTVMMHDKTNHRGYKILVHHNFDSIIMGIHWPNSSSQQYSTTLRVPCSVQSDSFTYRTR